MIQSIEERVFDKIKKAGRGSLFFPDSFPLAGNAKAVAKALERLVNKGELERVAVGLYVRPRTDPIIGKLTPPIEDIAHAIARRDRARIVPAGNYALNRLGLSTQVPMNIVYLTDGAARKVKAGNYVITFKKTTPKNVAAVGAISRLVIQAMRTIGKDKLTDGEIKKIQQLLTKEEPTRLEHDIRLAPAWIREIMKPALKQPGHE